MKKKKANFVKFMAKYLRIQNETGDNAHSLIAKSAHRQYWLLCEGIRDVRISDTAIYAWDAGNGEW